jgi:hypothetical protein
MLLFLQKQSRGAFLLVQKDFTMLFASLDHLLEASYTASIRLWTLQEATVAPDCVADAILCGAVEF